MGEAVDTILPGLVSPGPHPDIPIDQRIFAPLIGGWDLEVRWYEDGRITRREDGEWYFAWVLEGRGIQDVWIVPPRPARAGRLDLYEYGTSLRFYDAAHGAWRSTWLGPIHGMIRTFVARGREGRIELETDPGQGEPMRWIFDEVTQVSFTWRNFVQRNERWLLQQDFLARRKA